MGFMQVGDGTPVVVDGKNVQIKPWGIESYKCPDGTFVGVDRPVPKIAPPSQTPAKPICPPNGCSAGTVQAAPIPSYDSGSVIVSNTLVWSLVDAHGCTYASRWDAEKNVCAMQIKFAPSIGPITCSPVAPETGSDEMQTMVCWYAPKSQGLKK